ncbi:MAG: DUF3568 family protein [Gemmatimonadales bacterium]
MAAAGAGAAGGVYFTERGAESVVPVSVEQAVSATRQAFDRLKISQTKVKTENQAVGQKREISGAAAGRDVTVTLTSEKPNSTKVQVVARTSAVTWDKPYARAILEQIVAFSQ